MRFGFENSTNRKGWSSRLETLTRRDLCHNNPMETKTRPYPKSVFSLWQACWRDLHKDLQLYQKEERGFFRFFFHSGFQINIFYRCSRWAYLCKWPTLARFFSFLLRLFCGSDIHYSAQIDAGVVFPHGRGVIIGPKVIIKSGCHLFQNITLGGLETKEGFPVLEQCVNIYPYTVVAGKVNIGEYCRVGPNVYLTKDLPSHTRVSPSEPYIRSSPASHP